MTPTATRITAFAAARRLHDDLVARWRALREEDAAALLDLAEELRLGENHLRDLFEWAEEIAVRDGSSVAAVLAAPEVLAARSRAAGRNERVKLTREALRRLRFPQLAARESELAARIRALPLPSNVRISVPQNLGDVEVTVEIRGRDAAELRRAIGVLHAVAEGGAIEEIFTMLREVP